MNFQPEIGQMFGLLSFAEKIQYQHAKLQKTPQVGNPQENAIWYISSLPVDIRTSAEPIYREIGGKLISLPTKPPTPDHIVDVVNSSLR